MTDTTSLDTGPHNPSGWQVTVKTLLGLITGMIIAFLVFIMLILVGGILQEALREQITGTGSTINPLLPLIMVVIAFIGTFIGTIIIAGVYNLIYTDKYYDMGKMFSLTLIANVIMFVLFAALYLIFAGDATELFFVLAFHIIFTVFVTFALIEISTNPNYAAVHLIGAAIGLAVAVIGFSAGYKLIDINEGNMARILIALPPVLAYFALPLLHGLWEKLYYKFYTMGNNFFYIPSLAEVLVDEEDYEDVEVDMEND